MEAGSDKVLALFCFAPKAEDGEKKNKKKKEMYPGKTRETVGSRERESDKVLALFCFASKAEDVEKKNIKGGGNVSWKD